MKEITSRAFKAQGLDKTQVVSNDVWDWIVGQGWKSKYDVVDMPERKLKEVPVIIKPPEIKTKTKKVNG